MNNIDVAFITDNDYIIPTLTAIYSIKMNRLPNSIINIHVISADLSEANNQRFYDLKETGFNIFIHQESAEKYRQLHVKRSDSPCIASVAALLKFDLPNILKSLDKVLYLDGDIIVRDDLSSLFNTDINGFYLAAVIDSGSIYYKHPYAKKIESYFNSGVMLLNLSQMRRDKISEELVEKKKALTDSLFMDQDVFNVVCQGHTVYLPIKYNFLYVNLIRANGNYTIQDINQTYNTDYSSLDQIQADAEIIHYSSKDKPWKCKGTPLGEEWNYYYLNLNIGEEYIIKERKCSNKSRPKVSIIIPVYNSELWLTESLQSVLKQSFTDIEVICVNDGSTDCSLDIIIDFALKDTRIRIFNQPNKGQSAARNIGIRMARGEYIYLFDSDDILERDAIEHLYDRAKEDSLDLVFFNGNSFFESEELEKKFPVYKDYYSRKTDYPNLYNGREIMVLLRKNHEYYVSPCLIFFSKDYIERTHLDFYEGIIYEDNLFTMKAFLGANRVAYIPETLFRRRIRENSTITGNNGFYQFMSYLVCILQMYICCLDNDYDEEVIETVKEQLQFLCKTAAKKYKLLEPNERRKPWVRTAREKLIIDLLYDRIKYFSGDETMSIENLTLNQIMHIKIKGGVKCLKDNGVIYTMKRILVHLGLKRNDQI